MPKANFAAITVVWLILMGATGISFTLRNVNFPSYFSVPLLSAGIFLVAMVKVRFVVQYFMEIRNAPVFLRAISEAWIGIVGIAMLGLYLFW